MIDDTLLKKGQIIEYEKINSKHNIALYSRKLKTIATKNIYFLNMITYSSFLYC